MSKDLSATAALIAERMGLSFPEEKWADLGLGLGKAAAALGHADAERFAAELASRGLGQLEIETLASHLTIPETHFFRSPETFKMLQNTLLPELIARQKSTRRLRLWSAGCATGPEPYSLAILISRLLPDLADWDVSILATDINPAGFNIARVGEYTQWSFRGTPSWVMDGYFEKTRAGRYRLSPAIQKMVNFRYLNLMQDIYPAECDLILCRNVLMYFSRDTAVRVADRLRQSLRTDGYLLVTASETGRDIQGDLTSLNLDGEIIYKRTPPSEKPSAPAPTRKRPAPAPPQTAPQRSRGERAGSRLELAGLRLERRSRSRGEAPARKTPAKTAEDAHHGAAAEQARQLADKGRLDEALERCDAALEGEKLNPSLYYLKASILQELGRPEEAEQALESTLFLDRDFALARVMLGAIARSQARSGDAARHFREALALLQQLPSDSVLAETNGLTAGEMVDTVMSLMESERVS